MKTIKIVTFNLRCTYDTGDGKNAFIHRAGMILDKICEEEPHIICFQEITDKMRRFFNLHLNEYAIIGHGRNADYKGEGVSIAFRKECMELFAAEQFWLSPTPYIPASRYENQSEYPRTCVVLTLKHKSLDKPIRVYGVHLDHINDCARKLGISQILKKVTENENLFSCNTVVLGDFNATPESDTIALCNSFSDYELVDVTSGIDGTFHNFGKGNSITGKNEKIDYIYINKALADNVSRVYKWSDEKNGIFLSDHYPVCCEINF